jgi:hypothetical protein
VLLDGCIRILRFYDVGEAFDLDKVGESVGARGDSIKPDFPRRTPIYVRFESAPVAESGEPITLHTGERAARTIQYYAYAIVEIQLEVKFTGGWDELLSQASRWMDSADIEPEGRAVVVERLQQIAPAVVKPRKDWLQEEYLVVELHEIKSEDASLTADELLSARGDHIAQLIRGEQTPLARTTKDQILEASISYYPSDLLVVGSSAVLIYDRPDEAAWTIQSSRIREHTTTGVSLL